MTVLTRDSTEKMASSPGLTLARWGMALILAGYLLFAHGCHAGDHDDELFATVQTILKAEAK